MSLDCVVNRSYINENELIKNNQIIIFVKTNCQMSQKIFQECITNGIISSVKIVNLDLQQGKKILYDFLKQILIHNTPIFYSVKTGKSYYGYKPLTEVINEIITPTYSII